MNNITVSNLPNITFYTGEDAEICGEALENRNYDFKSDYYGILSIDNKYNSYWSYISNSTFSENPTNYNNIGDIINATISYMNKFKNNNVDIQINKNIVTFNYKYETDLSNNFDNTIIIPASQIIDLLVNVNDMTFNKKAYYKNKYELTEVSYARKNYPYRPNGTILNITVENSDEITTYDFSKQFVNYNYIEYEHYNTYTRSYMIPIELEDGTISYTIDPVNTYTEISYYYTYEIYDINYLSNRINQFFENNSNRVNDEYEDLKAYYISELNTILPLTLNTYSLSSKNLYAYFNFTSDYDNWFDNNISFIMNTNEIENNTNLLSIEPIEENWFNIIINDHDKPCGKDVKINDEHEFEITDNTLITEESTKFKIINPSKIKKIDLSENIDKITSIDFINSYKKKTDVYNSVNTNWMIEGGQNIETLIIGNNDKNGNIENIIGINNLNKLKEIDITNCNKLKKDFSIKKLNQLEIFKAGGSNIKNFVPKDGKHFVNVSLPSTLQTLVLKNNQIDEFNYTVNKNLINVTLENVSGNGLNTQRFIEDWINILSTTKIDEGTSKETTMLLDGIITNTNLTGINWENFNVDTLLKFKYLGLNKFSGNIQIKGSGTNNTLTRNEYLSLINDFGEEIMETWEYANVVNTKPIKFQYSIDQNMFKKNIYLYYYDSVEEMWIRDVYGANDDLIHKITINDTIGGHSLLDIFEPLETSKGMIEFKLNTEKFGYEYTLSKKISLNNNLTKNLSVGDIVLYKGNKLILVRQNITTPYNYVKLGKIEIPTRQYPNIVISFNTEENISETLPKY